MDIVLTRSEVRRIAGVADDAIDEGDLEQLRVVLVTVLLGHVQRVEDLVSALGMSTDDVVVQALGLWMDSEPDEVLFLVRDVMAGRVTLRWNDKIEGSEDDDRIGIVDESTLGLSDEGIDASMLCDTIDFDS